MAQRAAVAALLKQQLMVLHTFPEKFIVAHVDLVFAIAVSIKTDRGEVLFFYLKIVTRLSIQHWGNTHECNIPQCEPRFHCE
jgi:N-acetyl-anhydromuramyl-L-alanine amidase AmpD